MKHHRTIFYKAAFMAMLVIGADTASAQAAKTAPDKAGINDAKKGRAAVKRDPFWPVGYMPKNMQSISPEKHTSAVTEGAVSNWSSAMKKVVINGVSSRSDNEYYAVINGEVKSVGDTVSIRQGGMVYTWAVDGIEPPGSVKLRRLSTR